MPAESVQEPKPPEALPSVSDELVSRLTFAFVSSMLDNPESIPREVYRAYGISLTTETLQITDEQRKLVKSSLARTAASLEAGMPARVVKQITTPPPQPKREAVN